MHEYRTEYSYSTAFWVKKVLYFLGALLAAALIIRLIGYTAEADTGAVDTSSETPQVVDDSMPSSDISTESESTEVSDTETDLPFTIEFPDATGPTSVSTSDGTQGFEYALSDGTTVQIFPDTDNDPDKKSDFKWTHTIEGADANVSLQDTPTTFCSASSPDCLAGNGIMEISVQPLADSVQKVFIYISDMGDRDDKNAVEFYTPILESIRFKN